MGKEKAGFLTPKAIGNRIKAKGLQKLKWYCQMCQKQCRDENGFKCHLMSESHQRQLLLFADNPDDYVDQFSKDFLDGYSELLRRRFGTKRVLANTVYQEYINDRDHVHMNSTQWETLSVFVKWLGEQGHCHVDETEKGWFVTYIDRDPETIQRQEQLKNKEKMDKTDEELQQRFIEKQMERASEKERDQPKTEYTELKRDNEEERLAFDFGKRRKLDDLKPVVSSVKVNPLSLSDSLRDERAATEKPSASKARPGEKRKSALDEIMEFEEGRKEKANRRDDWLHENIVVKVLTRKLGDQFYKRKGVIQSVDGFVGVVAMLDSGKRVKIDQQHLETVIPAIGKTILVVNGAYRGHEAILNELNAEKFSCTVSIKQGPLKGRVLHDIRYEDMSKLSQPT